VTRRPPTLEEGRAALRREWRTADPDTRRQIEEIGRAITVWIETPAAKTPRRRRRR